ncbi:MAG: hypothetical protein M1830_001838 [Pleopsidium flavum]|nr:MAG: hypothetical protein M1830_001911 [Pleopsidium flavum]KAI9878121.1 MAG: hypothetical protein M1830_001838 [Pleopsidium flavum]
MSPLALTNLSNPLVTPSQLSTSASQLDGVPSDLETSIRYAGAKLTQAAGMLLQLSQDIIAQAVVVFMRFWVGGEGGSLMVHGPKVSPTQTQAHITKDRALADEQPPQDVSAASLYLMAKLSAYPQTPRSILNVYGYLLSSASPLINPRTVPSKPKPDVYYLSEGDYHNQRNIMLKTEAHILRILGFQTHVSLPYTISINYLQALLPSSHRSLQPLARRVFQQLNTALLSPQMLYLTHQPPALAVAAIYLAARETGAKLPEVEWWEVFDVEREELGFLVVGMQSMDEWVKVETGKWGKRQAPMMVDEVESECERRKMLEQGG